MNTFVTVIIAVLVFGFLILIHELGHFLMARLFHVSITEFSIGMGPRLLWHDSKKSGIRYSLAAFPIGGFVAMVGEDGSDIGTVERADGTIQTYVGGDPNAFSRKPAWQRFLITIAGPAVNIIMGLLAMFIIVGCTNIGNTTVTEFIPDDVLTEFSETVDFELRSEDSGLKLGDEILSVNGKKVKIADELNYEITRFGNKPVDLEVMRDGEKITLEDVQFPIAKQQGQEFGFMDFRVTKIEKNFGNLFSMSFRKTGLILQMCWESLYDLFTGRFTFAAVSGPVGISSAISDAARAGFVSLLNITVIISINLGFMNLLPIPALDGGRLMTVLFEMITRKKVPPKVEGIINGIGFILLMALTVVVLFKDIFTLF